MIASPSLILPSHYSHTLICIVCLPGKLSCLVLPCYPKLTFTFPHSQTHPIEVQLLSLFRQPTKNIRQHMPCQWGHKPLSFLSYTSAQILLNRCLAGRAQMWQYKHGDLGRSLCRISQKGMYSPLFPITLAACTFQVLDNLWHSQQFH